MRRPRRVSRHRPTRRRRVIASLSVLALLVAGGVAVVTWQKPTILIGTGYAAHQACELTRVAKRDDPTSDLPRNPFTPLLRIDTAGASTSAGLFGIAPRHAWYTEGFGCTLADEAPDLGDPTPATDDGNPFADASAPMTGSALDSALDTAFGEELDADEAADLGTRAVVVAQHGELIGERYAAGFDRDTPQTGWSVTKAVASLMTGVLVERGEIALDDDHLRREWDGERAGTTDERADITVEQLLRMTSGLAWNESYQLTETPVTRMLYLEPDMAAYVAKQPLESTPGAVQEYSSGSTNLLCSVLAERSGLGADLPRQTLFAPLGLSSATLETDAVGTPVCSSSLWATPRDWAAIGQFALQDGVWNGERLLPEGWMQHSVTPTQTDDGESRYALGWVTNQSSDGSAVTPDIPADTFYATGHEGQALIVVPSKQLVIVRLGHTTGENTFDPRDLARDVIAAVG